MNSDESDPLKLIKCQKFSASEFNLMVDCSLDYTHFLYTVYLQISLRIILEYWPKGEKLTYSINLILQYVIRYM